MQSRRRARSLSERIGYTFHSRLPRNHFGRGLYCDSFASKVKNGKRELDIPVNQI
jgi:hypothetical protein